MEQHERSNYLPGRRVFSRRGKKTDFMTILPAGFLLACYNKEEN